MITLTQLSLQRGTKILLENVDLLIQSNQKVGIIGANGCGKSSLFSLILGAIQPDNGDLSLPRNAKIAHLAQEVPALKQSALDYVLDGDQELQNTFKQLELADKKGDHHQIAALHEHLANIDAYTASSRAAQLLYGLGFSHAQNQLSVSEFSGGWRMRLNLAQTLMSRSDILLLDEPTNHLDLDALIWLEQWIMQYTGTLLLISHDRQFLDATVTHVAHVDKCTIKLYTGNYSAFEQQRAAYLALQQANFVKQQQKRAHLQQFIDRFRAKATKARQAQSRMKALARLEVTAAVHAESAFSFEFFECDNNINPLLQLKNAKIAYDDKTILSQANIYIGSGSRIGLLGPNGAGKSTLMKALAAQLEICDGEKIAHRSLRIGYFAQHQYDSLQLNESPLQHLRDLDKKAPEINLRNFLGRFGFSGDRALQSITHFSGGEKARLALALLVWQRPNLLLLDEPTNHLDLEMREALLLALQEYEGAMVIVSHDRYLLSMTTDQFMLVQGGQVQDFTGDMMDYQKWLLEQRRTQINRVSDSPMSPVAAKEDHIASKNRRKLQAKISKLDEQLQKLSKALDEQSQLLSDPSSYENDQQHLLQRGIDEQTRLREQIQLIEAEWLATLQELEALN